MSQSSLHNFYTTCKKKPDEIKLEDQKLGLQKSESLVTSLPNLNNEVSPFKVPLTPVLRRKKKTVIREVKSESKILSKKPIKNLDILNKQESILKWTKRTIDFNESDSEKKKKRLDELIKNSEKILNDRKLKSKPETPSCSVKKRLFDNCSKLDELREKISSDKTFLNKLKEFEDKTLSPVKLQFSLNSPSKRFQEQKERKERINELINCSPKKFLQEKLSNSPVKSPIKNNLPDGLNLPHKYKLLIDRFHCLDSVVSILFNRLETCTFDKIKNGIQKITKKNFDLSHLAQLVKIYPEAYVLDYEKKTAVDNLNNLNVLDTKSNYYLVVAPKVNQLKLTPSLLRKRKDEFEDKLLKYAKKVHNDFLLSLNPPVVVEEVYLTRWHPSFSFPDIPEAKLPDIPECAKEIKTADEFFVNKMKILPPPKVELQENEQDKTKITKGVLKGLSQGFLEKIKNKEALNLAKTMTRKPEIDKKINEMKKLPELIRIIHSFFTIEKRKAILLTEVIKKCCDSSTTFSPGNCSDLIYLTNETLPDWLLILKTSQGIFIKINKDTILKTLYDRLDRSLIKLTKV